MFYVFDLKDFISVEPRRFEEDIQEGVLEKLKESYSNKTDEEIGLVITVLGVNEIGEGFKLPETPERHYPVKFSVLTYKPEVHDVIEGSISSVTNFGAFVNLGIIEGLIHLTQTMADYVSFSKTGVIQGRESGRTLRAGDHIRAKVVAVSFRDLNNIKVGLTMRQPGLGATEWLKEEKEKNG